MLAFRLMLRFALVTTLFGCALAAQSQAVAIKGTIKNKATGEPLPYATVAIKNNTTGTTADAHGNFKLSLNYVHPKDTLVFSALGYHSTHLPVGKALAGASDFYLKPKQVQLGTVEVQAKHKKWKTTQVGYNIDKGTAFRHSFIPSDTVLQGITGQEIGNIIRFKHYPAQLQDFNFGLLGTGNLPVLVRLRMYTIKNNIPDKDLLKRDIVVRIPAHYTGWIKIDLKKYNISLQEDFVVALEWINEANKLNRNSLMTFAKVPKDQVTFYRENPSASWTRARAMSIGMYVTLLHS